MKSKLKMHLRDINLALVDAWKQAFKDCPDVEISSGDIFAGTSADAIVSPANSWGFMDGGIDMIYTHHFGWELSKELRTLIATDYEGELLVGQAAVVDIRPHKGDTSYKYLISAPTMRIPMDVSQTVNAYLAFRATLKAASKHPDINSVLCPGLGTAIGRMDPEICAKQMRVAWEELSSGVWHSSKFSTLGEAARNHYQMING